MKIKKYYKAVNILHKTRECGSVNGDYNFSFINSHKLLTVKLKLALDYYYSKFHGIDDCYHVPFENLPEIDVNLFKKIAKLDHGTFYHFLNLLVQYPIRHTI